MTSRRSFLLAAGAATVAPGAGRDPAFLTVAEASGSLRKKSVSPVELVEACLKRIESLNPRLNAFITVMADAALAQARQLEAESQRGRWRGPLHGIPVALKDNIDTAGVRTTAASELFKDRVPSEDAEVVKKLKNAGAILLGKTNLHEFAYGGSSSITYFGPVHNPWALDRVPGGSSGGSAAAAAAGLCLAALGTDTGGSIRNPASFCGIVGLKPTNGRASIRGIAPLAWSFDTVGPITRTVEDAALVLGAIAGYDEMDPTTVDAPVPDYSRAFRAQAAKLRVGMVRKPFFDGLHPEIAKATEAAVETLRKLTASVQETTLPQPSAPWEDLYARVRSVEAYAYHEPWITKTPEKYQTVTRERILRNYADVKGTAYVQARREMDVLRREVRKVFASVDLLVLPTLPGLPIPISQGADPTAVSIRNTAVWNLLGLPAISIPCGFSSSGLPIGLEIAGAPFAEPAVLALAHAYEQATDWHKRRPPL